MDKTFDSGTRILRIKVLLKHFLNLMTLHQFFSLFVPQFTHLKMVDNIPALRIIINIKFITNVKHLEWYWHILVTI